MKNKDKLASGYCVLLDMDENSMFEESVDYFIGIRCTSLHVVRMALKLYARAIILGF